MKALICAALLLFVSITSRSQFFTSETLVKEIGFSLSAMNCNTDIEGRIMDIKNFRPGVGLYGSVLYKQQVGMRLELATGSVTASDARGIRKYNFRNLDFTSTIKEISLLAEVHPLNFSEQHHTPALSPYLLAGIGYFGFDPRTQYDSRWVYLQPLHTEGQGFPETGRPNYKLSAVNFPLGGGLQYFLSERLSLRGEAVYRLLTTDYLDDVSTAYIDPNLFDKYLSQDNALLAKRLADRSYVIAENGVHTPGTPRGSKKKDGYYSINIKLGIRLSNNSGDEGNGKSKRKKGCFIF